MTKKEKKGIKKIRTKRYITVMLGDNLGWSKEKNKFVHKIITVIYDDKNQSLVAKFYKNGEFQFDL